MFRKTLTILSFISVVAEYRIPSWLVVLVGVLGVLGFVGVVVKIVKRDKRNLRNLLQDRQRLRLCKKCGYDLRGSKEQCPECGEEFVSTNVAR